MPDNHTPADAHATADGGPSPIRRLFANIGWLFAGRGFGALLSIVYLAIITQSLGPEKFGQFAVILSTVQAIYGIITFNTWQMVVRYGADHLANGEPEQLGPLIRLMLLVESAAAVVGFALSCGALLFFSWHFGWPSQLLGYAIAFALVHALAFRSTVTGLLRVRDRFDRATVGDSALPLVRFVGSLALLALGLEHEVLAFMVVWGLSELANAAALWLMTPRADRALVGSGERLSARQMRARYPGIIRFAWLTNISSTFAAINQNVMILVVGTFLGEAAAGFFRLGYQLGQALAKVAEVLGRATYTEFSRLRSHGDAAALARLMRQANMIAIIVALTIIAALVLVGRPALLLISGPSYLPALPLVILLGSAAAMDIIGAGYESALLSHDRAQLALAARIAGTAALAVGFVLLAGTMGAVGAAIAVLAAAIITTILLAIFARTPPAAQP